VLVFAFFCFVFFPCKKIIRSKGVRFSKSVGISVDEVNFYGRGVVLSVEIWFNC